MSSVQSSTNFLLILLITREIIKKQKIFRNHIKIRVFTDVFKRYQKESFVKTMINTLDIDCTGDKFTRTKRRTQGNFFLVRPVHVSHVSW